ncbi:MAG TPA: aspartate--tRNA ligase [Actinoallomurus sp.]|nr:aspartate--tRNA ligase [Actinoallomurus sp.]
MIRTHEAGSLRREHAGQQVVLAGWVARRRDHGGVTFIDLRDASGIAQVVFREEVLAAHGAGSAHDLRSEFCVKVTGEVRVRPTGNENAEIPTGDIEVAATEIEVLSESAPLPFPIETDVNVNEEVRLKYRYLDIRREAQAYALRVRSTASYLVHDVLRDHGFVNVETPTLTRSTPEGARDFLVPVRLKPGHWYALPQSPQLFKQLLMVSGLERYYQIARCYRDEDSRADRQPEFTQIDIEMSFVEQEDVLGVAEDLVGRLWSEIAEYEIPRPIPRMTYAEAMSRFGSDKPDLRFGNEIVEMTEFFKDTPFRVFQAPYVGAVVMPGGGAQTRKELDGWQDWAKARGAKGLAYVLVQQDGTLGGPVAKNLSDAERAGLADKVGAARLEIGRRGKLIDESQWAFVWVVDAPMFEETDEGGWTAVHHPFTSPRAEWADSFQDKPGEALANAYDIVCNGNEIGGGSIRIHRADMQQRVFDTLGLAREEAEEKFGFLLEAFNYGPPPHGGIAFGWDRIVMLLAGRDTIRDVIAFPKAASGFDPLTAAPTPITAEQRKEAGVDAKPEGPAAPPNEPGHIVRPSEERY